MFDYATENSILDVLWISHVRKESLQPAILAEAMRLLVVRVSVFDRNTSHVGYRVVCP